MKPILGILGFLVISAASVSSVSSVGSSVSSVAPNDDKAIAHALNRLAFGPTPDDVQRVKRVGLGAWIEQQLHPERIPTDAVDARLARLSTIGLDAKTIAEDYIRPAREERRRRQQQPPNSANPPKTPKTPNELDPLKTPKTPNELDPLKTPKTPNELDPPKTPNGREMANAERPDMMTGPRAMSETIQRGRQVFTELAEAKLLRAVYSERQLEEVLVDFWFNHFNVFARKGQTEVYITEYEREVIRPRVLGNFRDLLGATAKSPAMLFYLDNWMSADPNGAAARRAPKGRPLDSPGLARPSTSLGATLSLSKGRGRQRGLNENYARELLELHTLGVDGGYTQQDVVEVARALTGWTIGRPTDGIGFRFAAALHDRDEKRVLGHTLRAGGGIDDGERVLDLVASHPSTARHIAFKLAQRFVSDTPPPALVERAAARFRDTKGDLREVVRTIVTSPEFFAPESYRAKIKTPFEFVASALRATGAEVSSGLPVGRALAAMGMPLYLCQPPTGYDETAETWVSSGALVNRMNFAVELASNRLRGIRVPADRTTLARSTGEPDFQRQ